MVKVLLVGGAGFIGAAIIRQLLEEGDVPIVYDSFVRFIYTPDKERGILVPAHKTEERMAQFENKVTIIKAELSDILSFYKVMEEHKPEVVVHLAGIPLANIANKAPQMAIDHNLMGTLNILNIIKDATYVKRFVYTSSSMVYGNFVRSVADETHPTNPICNYGTTKLAGEILTKGFANRYNFEYTIIRPSAVYGPTDMNNRVTQIFAEKALRGESLPIQGSGESRLDFTFVEDIARGFVLAIKSPAAKNEIFNITRGESRSLKELVEIIKRFVPDINIIYTPQEMKRPERGTLDISKARRLLGFEPQYSLERGMEIYINYLKENILK